tara:strand:+ start:1996 stop:2109 length:114 start_codon:yes stop_codon:yes gene_type:complete
MPDWMVIVRYPEEEENVGKSMNTATINQQSYKERAAL